MYKLPTLIITFLFTFCCFSQTQNPLLSDDTEAQQKWVDIVYTNLSLEEKIGQLFMVQVMSNQDAKTKTKIVHLIKNQKIKSCKFPGNGICFN